tara:strand:+ start:1344 stop:1598 length:255 start_codon:yes stop_codon:yes gene_type:complete
MADEQEGISLKYSYLIEKGQKIWDAAKTEVQACPGWYDIEPERAVYYGWLSEQEDKNKPLKTYEEWLKDQPKDWLTGGPQNHII